MSASASTVLSTIPSGLRDPLLDAFNHILKNFRENRWEPAELNGGKLCEIVYTILRGHVDAKFPSKPSKPKNMVDACKALEQADQNVFPRSIRIQIPRVLMALYEIRNNRGVGHAGGDVDPNHMDAVVVVEMSKWIMGELVRIFHGVDTKTAQEVVETIVQRTLPIVWEVNGQRRVLKPDLSARDQTLILLYNSAVPLKDADLMKWVGYSNVTRFREVIERLHDERLVDYGDNGLVHLSPTGSKFVEKKLPLALE